MRVTEFYDEGNHFPEMHSIIWGEEYVHQLDFWMASELIDLAEKIGLSENSTVLDIGTGWGGPLILFAKQYGICGEGLEVSEHNINIEAHNAIISEVDDRIKFHLCDANNYQTEKRYDFIIMIDSLVHFKNKEKIMKKCYEWLSERGKILVAVECANSNITKKEIEKRNKFGAVYTEQLEEYKRIFLNQGFDIEYNNEYLGKRSDFAKKALLWMKGKKNCSRDSMNIIFELDRKRKVSEWVFVLRKKY